MAVFGDVMAVFMAMLWRCYGGVRQCYGGVMAVFGCYGGVRRDYGGVRRCSARLWRDLDDALKDEL